MKRFSMVLSVFVVGCISTGCGLGKALNPVGYAIGEVGGALRDQVKAGGLDAYMLSANAKVRNPRLRTFIEISTGIALDGFEGEGTTSGSGTGSKLSKDIRDALLKQLEDPNTTAEQRDAIIKMLYGSSTGIVVAPKPVPGTPPTPSQGDMATFMTGQNSARIDDLEQQMKDSEAVAAERHRVLLERLPAPK